MGKRGCRPVHMRTADAAIASRWLRGTAIPLLRNIPGTLLGGGYGETIERLDQLALMLRRQASRKRAVSEFSALIKVEDAAAFVQGVSRCRPTWPLRYHPAIIRLETGMQDGGKAKRRGRSWLTRNEVASRVAGCSAIDERHRKRLAARKRQDDAAEEWFSETLARGETFLTSTVPHPKI